MKKLVSKLYMFDIGIVNMAISCDLTQLIVYSKILVTFCYKSQKSTLRCYETCNGIYQGDN